MTVCVVVLNWRNAPDTEACLESLESASPPELSVVVVDNGSNDGSGERLASFIESRRALGPFWKRIAYIQSPENLGYAGGNNLGIRRALEQGADYVVVLNNDTVVDPQFALHLLSVADQFPTAAIVGSVIATFPEREIYFAGGTARFLRHRYRSQRNGSGSSASTDIVAGSSLLLRREFLLREGLLCEAMFLYGEEMELCRRARARGYDVRVAYNSVVYHKMSTSLGPGVTPSKAYYNYRSKLILSRITLRPAARWAYLTIFYLNMLRRLIQAAHDPVMRKAIRDAVRDGRRGIGGPWEHHDSAARR